MDIKDLCENHKVMIVMTPQQLKEFALSIIKDVKADEKKKEDARNADRIMTSREAYTSLRLYLPTLDMWAKYGMIKDAKMGRHVYCKQSVLNAAITNSMEE